MPLHNTKYSRKREWGIVRETANITEKMQERYWLWHPVITPTFLSPRFGGCCAPQFGSLTTLTWVSLLVKVLSTVFFPTCFAKEHTAKQTLCGHDQNISATLSYSDSAPHLNAEPWDPGLEAQSLSYSKNSSFYQQYEDNNVWTPKVFAQLLFSMAMFRTHMAEPIILLLCTLDFWLETGRHADTTYASN